MQWLNGIQRDFLIQKAEDISRIWREVNADYVDYLDGLDRYQNALKPGASLRSLIDNMNESTVYFNSLWQPLRTAAHDTVHEIYKEISKSLKA